MHNMAYDRNNKAIIANLSGNISIEEANTMLTDFKKAGSGINAKECILVINPENVTASLFVLPALQSFVQYVAQMNFKKIYLVNSDKYAAIIKQSLSSYGIQDNLRYVDSVKSALSSK